ncbi:hypothetical protein AVEN_197096-1 [Araneus ventricosus]|uniref:Uncharacterized protein n=1 Tax=Araneus ventricosus TaxID=182803 RepID=A0A4Y2VYM2_ARAVE|nr:hypothetical protein AVEN_197096-1 [Araneus ventricosus]
MDPPTALPMRSQNITSTQKKPATSDRPSSLLRKSDWRRHRVILGIYPLHPIELRRDFMGLPQDPGHKCGPILLVRKCPKKLSLSFDIVTNMESRFPAMSVLWLGREFYRDKYGMTVSNHVWSPDLRDKLGDKFGDFGDEIWDLKGAGIFSISLLGEEIRLNVLDDSM